MYVRIRSNEPLTAEYRLARNQGLLQWFQNDDQETK